LQARADASSAALTKLPDVDTFVYRGAELSEAQMDAYHPGSIVTEDGFTSTSVDRYQAFGGNTRFFIESVHGKDIAPYSLHSTSESEVLFDRGTSFRVTANYTDPSSGDRFIIMTEVP
jgi:hypothetical protein